VSRTDGAGYTQDVDNYNALVNGALEFEKVLFLTLNYDTLLDDRLFSYSPLVDMSSCVLADTRWGLVKLHGSVNWGRAGDTVRWPGEAFLDNFDYTIAAVNRLIDEAPLEDLSSLIELRLDDRLSFRRFDGKKIYYPALSMPLGSEDELVCDVDHVGVARSRLGSDDGIHLLVIGYSGLDQEVMKLLRDSGTKLRSLLVANGNEEASFRAAEAIQQAVGGFNLREDNIFAGGFTDLVATGKLNDFLTTRT